MTLRKRLTRLESQRPASDATQSRSIVLEPELHQRVMEAKAKGVFPAGLSIEDLRALMRAKRGEASA